MSLISFLFDLFGEKQSSASEQRKPINPKTKSSSKGYPSGSGLYPHEIVLLSMAEKYKTNETKFPDSLRTNYGIGFPKELFVKLAQQGYICAATAYESLNNLKLTELKAIAETARINISGKKADLCERLSQSISEQELEKFITDRYWKLTEKGRTELEENSYLELLTGVHSYSLPQIGIDVVYLNKLHYENPTAKVRDMVWGELNNKSISEFNKALKSKDFYDYCEISRFKALFLEEENKYQESLQQYCHYIYDFINFHAGFTALDELIFSKSIQDSSNTLYSISHMLFNRTAEVLRLTEKNNLDSKGIESYLLRTFAAESNTGVLSPKMMTAFIMAELSGDTVAAKKCCLDAMKAAKKRLK